MKVKEQDFRVIFGRMPDDSLLTVEEAASLVPCSPAALYKRIKRSPDAAPPAVRLGSDGVRFRAGAVRDWIRGLLPPEPAATTTSDWSSAGEDSKRRTGRPRLAALNLQGASVTVTVARAEGSNEKGSAR